MEVEMLHELDIVHEDLLADVALEGHVGLELGLQELGLALQRGVEVGLQLDQLLRDLQPFVDDRVVVLFAGRYGSLHARRQITAGWAAANSGGTRCGFATNDGRGLGPTPTHHLGN